MARDYSLCRALELTDHQVSGFVFSWFLENTENTKASLIRDFSKAHAQGWCTIQLIRQAESRLLQKVKACQCLSSYQQCRIGRPGAFPSSSSCCCCCTTATVMSNSLGCSAALLPVQWQQLQLLCCIAAGLWAICCVMVAPAMRKEPLCCGQCELYVVPKELLINYAEFNLSPSSRPCLSSHKRCVAHELSKNIWKEGPSEL